MVIWKWGGFFYPYVIFSWGTVIQQVFNSDAWAVVLIASIILGFRFYDGKDME
ncbi:hypothetical protein AD96_02242 [Klebsiella pneumoniae MGH 70]|nr:hypothetical protein AD96_02242 [Klebsiella pneumoniae MGH 70]DAG10710.1 MAG TPA: hypothetical protein [Caudoviricetes sp.]